MRRSVLLTTILIAGVTACSMIPHYNRPAPPIPAEWPNGPAYKGTTAEEGGRAAAEISWQDFYADERLQKIIDLALANNRDLRLATLNIDRAQALYRIQRGELLPKVDAAGSLTEQQIPASTAQRGEGFNSRQYSVDVGVTVWELDFFGRIRSLNQSALEQFFATEEARRSAQISLIAEIVGVYIDRAANSDGLRLACSTLEARETSYNLIKRRFDVGVASNLLDVRQAQTLLEQSRVDILGYTRRVALAENALNLLVGAPVPPELLADSLSAMTPPKEVTAGLSSDVLLNRPDVLESEYQLKSANANIGAARAAFFPRISLTTSIGSISPDLSGLFKAGSATWLFAPQIVMPIFDSRVLGAYQVTKVDKEISIARYEKTIQVAFRETADALAQYGTLTDQMTAQESLVEAASDTYRLANARYEKGIDNFLAVLDAQRSLYAAQQGLIILRLARLGNLVDLYKVLGGGM
jgi:outer membrane protein, multidrug efflux system